MCHFLISPNNCLMKATTYEARFLDALRYKLSYIAGLSGKNIVCSCPVKRAITDCKQLQDNW